MTGSAPAAPAITLLDPIASRNALRALPSRARLLRRIADALDAGSTRTPIVESFASTLWSQGTRDAMRIHVPTLGESAVKPMRVIIEVDPFAPEPRWIDLSGTFVRRNGVDISTAVHADHLPRADALPAIARHVRLFADALEGAATLTTDQWTLCVRSIARTPETDDAPPIAGARNVVGDIPLVIHASGSPEGDEALMRILFDLNGERGSIDDHFLPSPGLPDAMVGRLVGRRVIPSLGSVSTIVSRVDPQDAVPALRAVGELSRLTGWTPNAEGKR